MKYGTGEYSYELVDGRAKLSGGHWFADVCGLAVDTQDRLYILNRSDHPMMVTTR